MKGWRTAIAVLTVMILMILAATQSMASAKPNVQAASAKALVGLGLMSGDSKGDLKLQSKMKRYEFIALLNAAMSYDVEADAKASKAVYKDVSSKHKAYRDIMAASRHGLISPYSDNTVRPDKYITEGEALEMVLKALGYLTPENGDRSFEDNLAEAESLGLNANCALIGAGQLTRGKAAVIIYNALTIDFAVN